MRQLELSIEKDLVSSKSIFSRLQHKKECVTSSNRIFNKRSSDIETAKMLIKNGKLKSEYECICIKTIEELNNYKQKILEKKIYVLDMETTGLDIFNDIIVGMCLYVEGGKSAYIPINHTDIYNNRLDGQLTEKEVMECFKDVFINPDIRHILHNAKYDYKVIMWNWGIKIENVYFDTLIGSFLLNEEEPHGLKPLYNKYILKGDGDSYDFGDYFGNTPFNYIPIEVATIYGANDGIKTFKLYEFQNKFINKNSDRKDMRDLAYVFYNIEMPLIPLLADIEIRGVEIDVEYANKLRDEYQEELEIAEGKLRLELKKFEAKMEQNVQLMKLMGTEKVFNLSSPLQLQILFYDVLKLKSMDKKNPRGTGIEILHKLNEKYKNNFIDNLVEYRGIKKLLTTYIEKLPNIIEPKTQSVHTQFNQLGTATGRFSSSDKISKLNLQNIPSRGKGKRIRKIFVAREGKYYIGGDYSQVEPRILASMSGDINMKNSYIANKDLYSNMASLVYNVSIEECKEFREDGTENPEGKARRTSMKSVLLGLMYSRGNKSIAEQLGLSIEATDKIVNDFFRSFPIIKEYQQKVVYLAERNGFVTTMFGRKRRLPDMKENPNSFIYQRAFRQTLNAVIQGTAGDIMKLAMINIYQNEEAQKIGLKMLMTIHDEIICEIPIENAVRGKELLNKLMREVGEKATGLPMKCDIEVTDRWYGENIEL